MQPGMFVEELGLIVLNQAIAVSVHNQDAARSIDILWKRRVEIGAAMRGIRERVFVFLFLARAPLRA
jgi:hypothetical protein